jgi:hypothetical protein
MALSRHQKKVAKTIIKVGRKKGATAKELKAAIETGLVESNLTNIKGGDRDSSGWRQERASSYPGKNRNDVKAGASRFFNETRAVRGKYKKSGDLAQAVQRSAFPGKYAQRGKEAQEILRKLDKGGGGSSGGGSAVDKGINLPGVDRSDQRKQIVAQYLLSRNQEQDPDDKYGLKQSNSMLQMLVALKQAGDTPGKTIKGKGGKRSSGGGGKQGNGKTNINQLIRIAEDLGLRVGEHPKRGGVAPVHTGGSWHYKGKAIDVSGDPNKMAKFSRVIAKRYGKDLEEVFYNGPKGRNVKNGKKVGRGFVSGHRDHVHAADDD